MNTKKLGKVHSSYRLAQKIIILLLLLETNDRLCELSDIIKQTNIAHLFLNSLKP